MCTRDPVEEAGEDEAGEDVMEDNDTDGRGPMTDRRTGRRTRP